MNWLKRFWSCRVRGVHVWGRAKDSYVEDDSGCRRPIHNKTCKHCGTVRAVRRRKGKGA